MSGLLHFTLQESRSYKYIEIRLCGGAQVRWTEFQNTYGGGRVLTIQSEETFVDEARILWSSDQSPHGKIGPGTFDLPFQIVIPPNCLGSFQGSVGSISYTLHGLIKSALLYEDDHKIQAPIQVSRMTDINLSQLLMPVHQSKKKLVGFFCFGSDIEFTVSLSHTGFCIGQNLPLTVSVVNRSSRHVKIRATIMGYHYFYAQGRTKFDKRNLATVTSHDVAPCSQQDMIIEDLIAPMVEPSFDGSQIIKMQYFLIVTAVIPWALNSSMIIPITLGNVPLNNTIVT